VAHERPVGRERADDVWEEDSAAQVVSSAIASNAQTAREHLGDA